MSGLHKVLGITLYIMSGDMHHVYFRFYINFILVSIMFITCMSNRYKCTDVQIRVNS